jgi:TPR repeat protein
MNQYTRANIYFEDENYDEAIKCFIIYLEKHNICDETLYKSDNVIRTILNDEILTNETLDWIINQVNENNTYAQLYLGVMYYYGSMVNKDLNICKELIRKSENSCNPIAQFELSLIYNTECEDYHEFEDNLTDVDYVDGKHIALIHTLKSARQGHKQAQYCAGWMSLDSFFGPVNITLGLEMLQKSVDNGGMQAVSHLGGMYLYGSNVTQDIKKGLKMIVDAAKYGNIRAYYSLGVIYEEGKYIEQNYRQAYRMYTLGKNSVIGYDENDLLNKQSTVSKIDFDIMNNELDCTYSYPQNIKNLLEMDSKYYHKVIYETFVNYIPKDNSNIILKYIL